MGFYAPVAADRRTRSGHGVEVLPGGRHGERVGLHAGRSSDRADLQAQRPVAQRSGTSRSSILNPQPFRTGSACA
ncbi:MAG: hypothetical protein MZW92_25155 [Comamonadaceae bacterium]|nr:hypothetical protein [Comamonadaceae bacterium]